jgi:hypothetical protein
MKFNDFNFSTLYSNSFAHCTSLVLINICLFQARPEGPDMGQIYEDNENDRMITEYFFFKKGE